MNYFKGLVSAVCIGVFLFAFSHVSVAAESIISPEDIAAIEAQGVKTFESTQDVPSNKVWRITFNQEVNNKTLKDQQFIVWNHDSEEAVAIETEVAGREVKVKPKSGYYDLGARYSLYIMKGIGSKNDRLLKTTVKKDFTIQNEVSHIEIIAPKYHDARVFSEGLAAVKLHGKWGYIDTDGNTVINYQYDEAYEFSEGKALVKVSKNDEYGIKDVGFITTDNTYTPFILGDYPLDEFFPIDQSDAVFHNGLIAITVDNPFKFIFDETGEFFINSPHLPTEGIYGVDDNYIDLETDAPIFENPQFVNTSPFNQGMAAVTFYDEELSEYYLSFIDRNGETWNGPRFYKYTVGSVATDYQVFGDNSLANLMDKQKKWGAVNKEGQIKIPFIYEYLLPYHEGVIGFKKDGKFGYMNSDGQVVIPAQFDDVSLFNNGIAVAVVGDQAFLINKKGQTVKGSEKIPSSVYFKEVGTAGGDTDYRRVTPTTYTVIKEGQKYGFGKLEYGSR